jgi:hypothetical protein
MKTGVSILLALVMTGVLILIYRLHMLHRLWMKWKRTRQGRHCPTSGPPMGGSLPPLVIRPSHHGNAHAKLPFKQSIARQPNKKNADHTSCLRFATSDRAIEARSF